MESSAGQQAVDQHRPDVEFTVLIRWGDDPRFRVPIRVKAESMEEAARRRVDLLSRPQDYYQVCVYHSDDSTFWGDMSELEVFDVSQFIEPHNPIIWCDIDKAMTDAAHLDYVYSPTK